MERSQSESVAGPGRRILRSDRFGAGIVLGVLLVVSVPVYFSVRSGDTWFLGDEWGMIIGRGLWPPRGWFRGQNGHWNTVPVLLFRSIYAVVGVRSFGVYRLLPIFAHLAVVALSWWYMCRLRVGPWLALFVMAPFLVMASSFNVLAPIQVGLIGSVSFGLGALIATDHEGPFDRRDALGLLLGLLSLASSNQGIVVVAAVVAVMALRRGWRPAATFAAPLLVATAVWRATSVEGGVPLLLDPAVLLGWTYQGVTATFSGPTQSWLGAWILVALLAAGLWQMGRRAGWRVYRERYAVVPVFLLALAANFVTVATQRGWFGSAWARTDRYLYFSVVCLLPLLGLAAQELGRMRRWLPTLMVVPLVLGVPGNLRILTADRGFDLGGFRAMLLNVPEHPLARQVDPTNLVEPNILVGRSVTVGFLLQARDEGRLPPAPAIPEVLRQEIRLRLALPRLPSTAVSAPNCETVASPLRLELQRGDVLGTDRAIQVQEIVDDAPVEPRLEFAWDYFFNFADYIRVDVPEIVVEFSTRDGAPFRLCRS